MSCGKRALRTLVLPGSTPLPIASGKSHSLWAEVPGPQSSRAGLGISIPVWAVQPLRPGRAGATSKMEGMEGRRAGGDIPEFKGQSWSLNSYWLPPRPETGLNLSLRVRGRDQG